MITLLFHPTEELLFINFQKELIADLNSETDIFYSQTPLYIDFPFFTSKSKNELKQIVKSIKQIKFDSLFLDDKTVFIPVTIITETKTFSSRLNLIHKLKGNNFPSQAFLDKKKSPVENLKIFRLGIMNKSSNNTYELSDFVWAKL